MPVRSFRSVRVLLLICSELSAFLHCGPAKRHLSNKSEIRCPLTGLITSAFGRFFLNGSKIIPAFFLNAGYRPSLSEVKIAECAEEAAQAIKFRFFFLYWRLKIPLEALRSKVLDSRKCSPVLAVILNSLAGRPFSVESL